MFNWTKKCETTTHHDVNAKYVSDKGVDLERMVVIINHRPKQNKKNQLRYEFQINTWT
jgi:hypothetical protein